MSYIANKIKLKLANNPKGLFVLFYTEMWELFGRFGITALLIFYLTNTFHLSDSAGFAIYSGFIALIYVMPIIGGYFSDRFIGLQHAVILGASLMVLGNAILIIPNLNCVYLGLGVIAVGSGFFLPSIVPLVGKLYQADRRGRDAGFTLYYIGKNIGALLAPILCGLVAKYWNYNYAFILSTLGMLSGLFVFIKGQKHLASAQVSAGQKKLIKLNFKRVSFVYVVVALLIPLVVYILLTDIDGYLLALAGIVALGLVIYISIKSELAIRKRLLAIVLMLLFIIVFSALLGQGGTTLNLFIERIINRQIAGWAMPPTFYYTLDPIFMILAGPFLAALWAKAAGKQKEPSEIIKFVLALSLLGFGFVVFAIAAHIASDSGSASSWFVVVAYAIFPIAELCIMPIGLSFVTRLSPERFDAMMVGVWMLGYSASGYFTGLISNVGHISFTVTTLTERAHAAAVYFKDFSLSAGVLFASATLLLLLSPVIKRLIADHGSHVENTKPADIYY